MEAGRGILVLFVEYGGRRLANVFDVLPEGFEIRFA